MSIGDLFLTGFTYKVHPFFLLAFHFSELVRANVNDIGKMAMIGSGFEEGVRRKS